jgi:hypothetical protein
VEISSEARARASRLVVFCGTTFVRKREINKAGHNPRSRINLLNISRIAKSGILHFHAEVVLQFGYSTAAIAMHVRNIASSEFYIAFHYQGSSTIGLHEFRWIR